MILAFAVWAVPATPPILRLSRAAANKHNDGPGAREVGGRIAVGSLVRVPRTCFEAAGLGTADRADSAQAGLGRAAAGQGPAP